MAIKDRIKEARLKKGYTQEQLAREIGVAKSTVTGYEKGNSEPSIETIIKIMVALDIDANYLWQDECDFPVKVSYDEMEHIKKYRDLNDHGKEVVDLILEKEYQNSKSKENNHRHIEHSNIIELNAAHEIPNSTAKDKEHDDAIMDDKNF